jgi:toxin ParE1/3/4
MGKTIIWSAAAFDDLKSIHDYIARDSQAIASSFVDRLLSEIDLLSDFPFIGPRIREWKSSPYRHLVVSPYRVTPGKNVVFLIAIVHGARDLKRLFKDRN